MLKEYAQMYLKNWKQELNFDKYVANFFFLIKCPKNLILDLSETKNVMVFQ